MTREQIEKRQRILVGHLRSLHGKEKWAIEHLAAIRAEIENVNAELNALSGQITALIHAGQWNPIT